MQVFLIRHAEGVPETPALIDRHRHLSATGRVQARALGTRLRWHDCLPTHLWSSPLVRALQTAELVASGLACEVAVETLEALGPDEDPRDVLAALATLAPDASVVLVGHEPGLSIVGASLVGRPRFPNLAKAQAARIDNGELRWRFSWDAEAPEIAAR